MKKIFLAVAAIATLAACSKDNNPSSPSLTEGTFPKKITTTGEDGKVKYITNYTFSNGKLIAANSIHYDSNGTIEYNSTQTITYNGDLVSKLTANDGNSSNQISEYSYIGNKLQKETRTDNESVNEINYAYDGDKLISIIESEYKKNNVNNVEYKARTFTYSGNTISETEKTYKKVNNVDTDSEISTITYTHQSDNLIKSVRQRGVYTYTYEYAYDSKNNPNYNTLNIQITPDYFSLEQFSKNNILTETYTSNNDSEIKIFEYEYNDKGYPTKKVEKRNGVIYETEVYEY